MKLFKQRRAETLRRDARVDRRIPSGVATGAFIDQPNIQALSVRVDAKQSCTEKTAFPSAFFAVSNRNDRRPILHLPGNFFHTHSIVLIKR